MIATPLVEMNQFADTLRNENPGLAAEVTALPSGAAVLDIHHNGRALVMARSSAGGFGVAHTSQHCGRCIASGVVVHARTEENWRR